MKILKPFVAFSTLALFACSTPSTQTTAHHPSQNRRAAALSDGIDYPANRTFDLADYTGQTYITFLKKKVKPALDSLSATSNGGGGGFKNVGSGPFTQNTEEMKESALFSYKGAKWNRVKQRYEGGLDDETVASVYDALASVRPKSTVDSLTYYKRGEDGWAKKNDMAIALKEAGVNAAPFDLATLYALTSGLGVKVKIDDRNYNYHVLYKTGKTKPNEEVMSGRSFAATGGEGATDATDPEYLRDLEKYLTSTSDQKPFYRAMIRALANSDPSGWTDLSTQGQALLSDFLTVYTAEADRHLMVNLQAGNHPWEIDLAAVTFVSAFSAATGKVVVAGELIDGNLGKWFAPSPNNTPDGPQRSGIGITRKDRKILQGAINKYEMKTTAGKKLLGDIRKIIGTNHNKNDIVQGVFEFLSRKQTPEAMGANADKLAELVAELAERIVQDAEGIAKLMPAG